MASFSYATTGSGPSASAIGWINFGPGFVLTPGSSITGLSAIYLDGSTVTFDISMSLITGAPMTIQAVTSPSYGGAAFGVAGYTGIPGQVILYSNSAGAPATNRVTISNVSVKDSVGNPISNYTMFVGDGEETGTAEELIFNTNGSSWNVFTSIRNASNPQVTGIGTTTVNIQAVSGGATPLGAPIVSTNSPTTISADISTLTATPREGFVFGFTINKVTVQKNIVNRYNPNDQFQFYAQGSVPNTTGTNTTFGVSTGLQTPLAIGTGFPNQTYTITENMTPTSSGSLSNYSSSITWINLNADGTTVPVGQTPLGTSVQITAGDNIVATITNSLVQDFGDAPDTGAGNGPGNYSTLLAQNGPRHGVLEGLTLGTKITAESDAYQNVQANGDDLIKGVQDDGIITPILFTEGSHSFNVNISYTNNTGKDAKLYAWFDFNQDGIFQLSEAQLGTLPITLTSSTTNPRTTSVTFIVPAGGTLLSLDKTYLRVRITTETLVNTNTLAANEDTRSIGPASDGEVEDYLVSVIPPTPFTCDQSVYQVVRVPSSTTTSRNSQFNKIDPVTGNVTQIKYDLGYVVNAIGYNTMDNYIYGMIVVAGQPMHLVRISAEGNVIDLGTIPNISDTNNLDVGCFDDKGFYYLKNSTTNSYYTIDLRLGSINYGKIINPMPPYPLAVSPFFTTLSPSSSTGGDWTYNPKDSSIYTVNSTSNGFLKINPTTGVTTILPITPAIYPLDYEGMFSDANGFIYGISNSTGQIIRWQNISGTMNGILLSNSNPVALTDATMCVNKTIDIDFGDAPDIDLVQAQDNYSTLLINNGPRHGIINELYLGSFVTSEFDAYQNPTATGDDIINGIQDDGPVAAIIPIVSGDTTYSLPLNYTNNIGSSAVIYGWIDFNRDGIFQVQEAAAPVPVVTNSLNPRTTNLKFNIPNGTKFNSGDTTFIRVRITSDPLNNSGALLTSEDTRSIGPASDGEVEDYQVKAITLSVSGTVWYDTNCNGIREAGELLAQNITVELHKVGEGSLQIITRTTDINGNYLFDNLATGEYYIKVNLPNNYKFTLVKVGTNNSIDSDIDRNTGESVVFKLDFNNLTTVIDAGLCRCNNISGKVFYDCNRDGIFNNTDPTLCGVTVKLTDSAGKVVETITDCEGYYKFDCICADTYTLSAIPLPDMQFTIQNSALFYGSKINPTLSTFTVMITNTDYVQGYIGFRASDTAPALDLKYCLGCLNTCSSNTGSGTSNNGCSSGSCKIK